jgi:hypothetical protein
MQLREAMPEGMKFQGDVFFISKKATCLSPRSQAYFIFIK